VLVGHQPRYVHGKAQYQKYPDLADELAKTDPKPDIFLASCWPSMDALRNSTLKGIIFTGLSDVPGQIDYSSNPRITGIKGFAAKKVCPNWLALLRQIAPGINRAAVIYDQDFNHPSMQAQYDEIKNSVAALGSLQTIHAEDPDGKADVNPHIKDQIADFAQ